MKTLLLTSLALIGILASEGFSPLMAQETPNGKIIVKQKLVQQSGNDLVVDLAIDLSQIEVSSNRTVVCTPLIEKGDSLCALPPVVVNGRNRHIIYERSGRSQQGEYAVRRYNKKQQVVNYHATVPYRKWMNRSEVSLVTDLCGCGWEALQNEKSPLFALNLVKERPAMKPLLVFMAPAVEHKKERSEEGSAFLDFPVNKIQIYPDYRNNSLELAKIRETIESVRNDQYATITEVYIKGYASPEGSYRNNSYLAEYRAKALSDHVRGLYDFEQARFTVDFEPEDWAGLKQRVASSGLSAKKELLEIICAEEPKDFDRREWKLKQFQGGVPYAILLREIYPALRHSDYAVKYTIRNFTVDEAKHLIYTDPKQLSLEEMYQVAQSLEPGSDAFREVFEIAVRMYPDDPVSNLNAALTAIAVGRTEAARRYLAKAAASPEKELAEASVYMLEGKYDEAAYILRRLKSNHTVAQQAEANLKLIEAYKE